MLKIDKAIQDTSDVISNNISTFASLDRGLLSQNILSQLRNFAEYVAKKIYSNGNDFDPNICMLHPLCIDAYESI